MSDVEVPAKKGGRVAPAIVGRMRAVYRLLSFGLVGAVVWAIATPAYAAETHSHHIYTVGRQSTLVGAIMILFVALVSIRRNLRRSPRIESGA
jgi:hypothetical protein